MLRRWMASGLSLALAAGGALTLPAARAAAPPSPSLERRLERAFGPGCAEGNANRGGKDDGEGVCADGVEDCAL